jgi:hypothetical protein
MLQQMELYKLKKIMNCFVFKHHIFGFQPIGLPAMLNMVCYREEKKTSVFLIINYFILAIYLLKRTLRNRQRHGLEEHELVCFIFDYSIILNDDIFV